MTANARFSVAFIAAFAAAVAAISLTQFGRSGEHRPSAPEQRVASVQPDIVHDLSPALASIVPRDREIDRRDCDKKPGGCGISPEPRDEEAEREAREAAERDRERQGQPPVQAPTPAPAGYIAPPVPDAAKAAEQTAMGSKPAATIEASFDGLGAGFTGPHGPANVRNPSDNSLAVGPDNVVQIVNSRMAIFTKKGKKYDATGTALYGPVPTNTIFKDFGGACESRLSGDAVVRYDQLADRWLFVLPIFQRYPYDEAQPEAPRAGAPATLSTPGRSNQPGRATKLNVPPPPPPPAPLDPNAAAGRRAGGPPATPPGTPPGGAGAGAGARGAQTPLGVYSMCYAVSTSSDPLGQYYRYEFLRPLFPDYPRPAVWPDGYYVPTSTGDNRISESVATEKHACVADRTKMLKGEPATEQCVIIHNVNFLNNADLDGKSLPPSGAPNIMMAAGGTQLDKVFESDVIDVWQFHVDWADPTKTKVTGPEKIKVAPYHYLCDGQLTSCVPQPGSDRRLDAQGDKIMARLAYRRIGNQESIVAVHSVNTSAGGGGVRWYEFRVAKDRAVTLHQQGTYAPEGFYRWMASPAIDKTGAIGIGYSFGGPPHFAGQRFAGRLANDPLGQLTLRESILIAGEAPEGQPGRPTTPQRWEDYTQTAVDPSDDCTIWYVGDYVKKDQTSYSSRIGAFKIGGCR